jgi:DNA-binding transcriptional ArsR family regulator
MTLLRLDAISDQRGINIGEKLDRALIEHYAEILDLLPPIVVFGDENFLGDGFDRVAAARKISRIEDVCACDFDVHSKLTQPTVSHHLRVLREAGVVRTERRGTFVHYSLEPAAVERLAALVRSLRRPTLKVSIPGTGERPRATAVVTEVARVTSGR